jgi:hypothetical protein
MAMVVITRRRQIELKMKWKFIGNQQLRFDDLLREKGPCLQWIPPHGLPGSAWQTRLIIPSRQRVGDKLWKALFSR